MSKRATSSKLPLNTSSYTLNLNQRQATSAKYDPTNVGAKKDELRDKEEEYKRLNAELEKKTANLVYEAEQVLKANEKLLSDTDYLNKIADIDMRTISTKPDPVSTIKLTNVNQANKFKSNLLDFDEISTFKTNINKELESEYGQGGENISFNNLNTFLTTNEDEEEKMNMIPRAANEMSNEAQIRFLKAKLKVMQEEVDRFSSELNKKEEENLKLAQRCKELDEDRAKQLRISNSHQTQLEKFKKLNEEFQLKVTQSDTQYQLIKKENDALKKDLKKTQQDQQQLEMKQNRSTDAVEKLKLELSKQLMNKKDMNEHDKLKFESLSSENKRLQKQKVELIQAFKKQLKLIDILKKQKMHLEAAKILQFSEQEFINALEWNANTAPTQSLNAKKSERPPSGNGYGSNRNMLPKPTNLKPNTAQKQQQKPIINRSKSDEMLANNHNNQILMNSLVLEDNLENEEDDAEHEKLNDEYDNYYEDIYNENGGDDDLNVEDFQLRNPVNQNDDQ